MLAGELNREYSVLKSSLGESMNAPPIMGNCKKKEQNEPGLSSRDHTFPEARKEVRFTRHKHT